MLTESHWFEDQATLDLEETVFDKHVNRVAEIIERPDQLVETERSVVSSTA